MKQVRSTEVYSSHPRGTVLRALAMKQASSTRVAPQNPVTASDPHDRKIITPERATQTVQYGGKNLQ